MEKDILYFLIMFAICMLQVIIIVNDWKKPSGGPSHIGATEPSKLPPPPEPKAYGSLFLHIQFFYHVNVPQRPDIYLRADKITSIIGDCHDSILTIVNDGEEQKFEDVEQYRFVKQSVIGDFLFEEEL